MKPNDKVQEFFKGLTAEERLAFVANITKEANKEINAEISEEYINKTAGKLALMAGINPMTKYGKPLSQVWIENYGEEAGISKAIGDFTGGNAYLASLVTFDRNDLLESADAMEYWNLVFEHGQEIMGRISKITGTKKTGMIDIFALEEENLISSLRAGEQPGTGLKQQVGIIGKEYFARNIEMQFDISQEQLMSKMYDPQFENKLSVAIYIGWANDLLRLATNGVSDDYSSIDQTAYNRTDMYKLAIGWTKICQDGNGSWTNSNAQALVIGMFGDRVTCNKYRIVATGSTSIYTKTDFTDVDGFVDQQDGVGTVAGSNLVITKGTTGDIAYLQKSGIACTRNLTGSLSVRVVGGGATAESYAEVLGADNTVLGTTILVIGTAATTLTCNYFTGENTTIKIRVHQTTNAETAAYDTFVLSQVIATHSGFDIIDIMNGMITNQPIEYRDKTKYAFILGPDDLDKYAEAKGDSIRILAGNYVGINNITREKWTVEGIIPRHKGFEVMFNPYMDSISETVTRGGVAKYGSILLCDPKDLVLYGLEEVQKYREFKVRRTVGGPGVEITTDLWTDPQVTANERIGIAYQGAQVEDVVLMQTGAVKSTACVSATTTAVAGFWPYCDTKGALIYMTLTSNVADLATLALAKAGVTAGDVWLCPRGVRESTSTGNSGVSAAAHSFAAFKETNGVEVLDRSDVVACTFA